MEIRVPLEELEFSYARSSGPGGQNVNKVNSKCVLRWDVVGSRALGEAIRVALLAPGKLPLTSDGHLVIMSDRFRDQARNRADCVEKLRAVLQRALSVKKARRKSKPTVSSRRKARESKARHALKKSLRRKPIDR